MESLEHKIGYTFQFPYFALASNSSMDATLTMSLPWYPLGWRILMRPALAHLRRVF